MQPFDIDNFYIITQENVGNQCVTGYYSYAAPKLYRLGDARRVCNEKNKWFDRYYTNKEFEPNNYDHMRKPPYNWDDEKINGINEGSRQGFETNKARGRYIIRTVREHLNRIS